MKRKLREWDIRKMILWIIGILIGIVVTLGIVAVLWNFIVELRPENKVFSAGTLPNPALQGHLKGSYGGTSWKGKEFNSSDNTGINIVGDAKQFPFETSVSKSLHGDHQVLKLNYNIAKNPWWLRLVVDELVQTKPGKYQGKVYVQVIPGLPVAITYFQLEK
jgi:hypothetical protein